MGQLQFRSDDTVKWLEGYGNGLDGDLTISSNTTEAPIDASCTATAGTTTISATNASFAIGQIILIHKTRGNTTTTCGTWEINKIAGYSAGTITTVYPMQNAYQDSGADQSQVRVLKQYNNVTINGSQTYASKAWAGDVGGIIGFFAKGTVTVTGTITATGLGFRPGTQTNHGAGSGGSTTAGEGSNAAEAYTTNTGGSGGGGTYKPSAYQATGAGGGHAAAGSNGGGGDQTPIGGIATGNAGLTVLTFGGGGGDGWGDGSGNFPGGAGGGAVVIFGQTITVTGAISARGNAPSGTTYSGGGGAGGSILLKGKNITLGTTLLNATNTTGGSGGAGSTGRIHADYKTSISGTTSPTIDSRQDLSLDYPAVGGAILYNFV